MRIIHMLSVSVISSCLFYSLNSLSAFSIAAAALPSENQDAVVAEQPTGIVLAQADRRKPAAAAKGKSATEGRKSVLKGEKVYRGESRKVDFDAVDISGERKNPYGSVVNQNKPSKDYDLIRIRLRWHDEMKQSASSLETGRGS